MKATDSLNIETELTDLALQLITLSQDLVTAKLQLEAGARNGWLHLAQARYKGGLGHNGVSRLQLPTEEQEQEVVANRRVTKEECLKEDSVRYFHYSFEDSKTEEGEEEEDGVKRRKPAGVYKDQQEEILSPKKNPQNKDPIKWFGILTPPSLKQSQTEFQRCLDMVVEIANLQSEIGGVQARIKYLYRMRRQNKGDLTIEEQQQQEKGDMVKKSEENKGELVQQDEEQEGVVENLDCRFKSNLVINN